MSRELVEETASKFILKYNHEAAVVMVAAGKEVSVSAVGDPRLVNRMLQRALLVNKRDLLKMELEATEKALDEGAKGQ